MTTPEAYNSYFEAPAHWGRTYATVAAGERLRLDALIELLPDDAEPVLDAGCGDGLLTNLIFDRGRDVVGLDFSVTALAHVRAPTAHGSVDALPFPDRSFGSVIAANLLEHLPAGVFERTIAELNRVATRYLLVSTPHLEDLALLRCCCSRCATTFHPAWHVRSIDVPDLALWFPDFRLREVRLTGEPAPRRSRSLQRLAQVAGNVWYPSEDAVCPACGYRLRPQRPNRIVWALNGAAQRVVGLIGGSRPTQLVACLERRIPQSEPLRSNA